MNSADEPNDANGVDDETVPTVNNHGLAFHLGWAETVQYDMATPSPLAEGQQARPLSDQPTLTQVGDILASPSVGQSLITLSSGAGGVECNSSLNNSIGSRVVARSDLGATSAADSADYTMLGELGRGGMGAVHLARQASLRRMVAIKTIRSDRRSLNSDAAFLDEAWVTGALEHPNIVPIYDAAFDQGELHFILCHELMVEHGPR